MLSDIITLILGFVLVLFGVQDMLLVENRRDPTEVIRSVIHVTAGIFLMYYWNIITKASY